MWLAENENKGTLFSVNSGEKPVWRQRETAPASMAASGNNGVINVMPASFSLMYYSGCGGISWRRRHPIWHQTKSGGGDNGEEVGEKAAAAWRHRRQ